MTAREYPVRFRVHRAPRPHITVHVDDGYRGPVPGVVMADDGRLDVSEGRLCQIIPGSVYAWRPAEPTAWEEAQDLR